MSLGIGLLADGEADEALDDHVLARLGREVGAQLLDRLAVVLVAVDVLLVEEHDLLVPALELALDDLGADVLRLVGDLLLEDAGLAVLVLLRDLVLGDVPRLRRGGDVQREVLREVDEVLVLGDEVGVALDLDEHADLAGGMHVGLDGALRRLAPGELADLVAHPDAQDLLGLGGVAAGLGEGVLAVHHAGARLLAKGLDVGSADRGAHGVLRSGSVGGYSGLALCAPAGPGSGAPGWPAVSSGWTASVGVSAACCSGAVSSAPRTASVSGVCTGEAGSGVWSWAGGVGRSLPPGRPTTSSVFARCDVRAVCAASSAARASAAAWRRAASSA